MNRSGFICGLVLAIFTQNCLASGVALSSTRVIYNGSKKEASLTVNNKSSNEEYLIQSWIDDVNGSKKTPFIITPPLFKLDPAKNNVLRIVKTSDALPQDRESVFWINVKSIPAKSEDAGERNVLQIAVRTRLKLFYRPAGLQGNSMDAWHQLRFSQAGNDRLKIENPSAFNLTFNDLLVNGVEIKKAGMVPAKGEATLPLSVKNTKINEIKYSIINDFGTAGEMLTQRVN